MKGTKLKERTNINWKYKKCRWSVVGKTMKKTFSWRELFFTTASPSTNLLSKDKFRFCFSSLDKRFAWNIVFLFVLKISPSGKLVNIFLKFQTKTQRKRANHCFQNNMVVAAVLQQSSLFNKLTIFGNLAKVVLAKSGLKVQSCKLKK